MSCHLSPHLRKETETFLPGSSSRTSSSLPVESIEVFSKLNSPNSFSGSSLVFFLSWSVHQLCCFLHVLEQLSVLLVVRGPEQFVLFPYNHDDDTEHTTALAYPVWREDWGGVSLVCMNIAASGGREPRCRARLLSLYSLILFLEINGTK